MISLIDRIITFLAKYFQWQPDALESDRISPVTPITHINPVIEAPMVTNSMKLYETAKASLGKDMSPENKAPNSLACMESMDGVYLAAFGEHLLDPDERLSTQLGYQAMLKDGRLEPISAPEGGCIVICPTGYSSIGTSHGHTGVWGEYDVMSNDSNTGLWSDNYTHDAWYNLFQKTLGFPVFYFKVK